MSDDQMSRMGGGMKDLMQEMHPKSFLQQIQHHASSGTSAEPNSTPTPMLMTMKGEWMLMFHANAFILDTQQSSSRGGDKLFSTNWFMPMVEREFGPGTAHPESDVQPGAGDDYQRALPVAVSARRDCIRRSNR